MNWYARLFQYLAVIPVVSSLCPIGALQGISNDACYIYSLKPLLWFEADVECGRAGGTLTSVTNAMANSFIADRVEGTCYAEFWLGATTAISGKWSWTDGSRFGYSNWAIGKDPHVFPVNEYASLSGPYVEHKF